MAGDPIIRLGLQGRCQFVVRHFLRGGIKRIIDFNEQSGRRTLVVFLKGKGNKAVDCERIKAVANGMTRKQIRDLKGQVFDGEIEAGTGDDFHGRDLIEG